MFKSQGRRHIYDSSNEFGAFDLWMFLPAAHELIARQLIAVQERRDRFDNGCHTGASEENLMRVVSAIIANPLACWNEETEVLLAADAASADNLGVDPFYCQESQNVAHVSFLPWCRDSLLFGVFESFGPAGGESPHRDQRRCDRNAAPLVACQLEDTCERGAIDAVLSQVDSG